MRGKWMRMSCIMFEVNSKESQLQKLSTFQVHVHNCRFPEPGTPKPFEASTAARPLYSKHWEQTAILEP